MVSTLYADAQVPSSDDVLMRRLREELAVSVNDTTATMYRFAMSNEAGVLYRLVIVYGPEERRRALEILSELGYRQKNGPVRERGLDAVFLAGGPEETKA